MSSTFPPSKNPLGALTARIACVAKLTPNMVTLHDSAGRIEWVNRSFEEQTGYTLQDARGLRPSDFLIGPETDQGTIREIRRSLFRGEIVNDELLVYRQTGEPFWVSLYCAPVDQETHGEQGFVVIQSNITDKKANERNLRIAASVFDRSHEAILITDHTNRILDINPAFSRITGYSRDEVLGLNPAILSSGRHSREYYGSMWQSIEKTDHWRGEVWNRRKNGEEYAELLSISRIHLEQPGKFYHVAAFSDITALKNHDKELEKASHYDELTGLPNRKLFEQKLRTACSHADRLHQGFSVCCVDLDGFKAFNDLYGRDAGDQALRRIAESLTRTLRSGDTVARTGGDEFMLMLQGNRNIQVFTRLFKAISQPVFADGETIKFTGSLGVTRYPDDDSDADGLIRHANQALFVAKEKGRNRYHLFDPELEGILRQRREQLSDIERGLEQGEFELYFQPQIRTTDSELLGFEALIRWDHPTQGILAPGQFLPALENSHLEVPLGQWVVSEAFSQLNRWHDAGETFTVSINISAPHLMDRKFIKHIESYLRCHPTLPPHRITLEVLESTALEDTQRASDILKQCREMGLKIALDDFGTGFSSLTYMRTLPVDIIKIDQSFVRNMLDDESDDAIVESVIFLAQRFARPALAEGVESDAHAKALERLGCHAIQGYAIARPMPADQVLPWSGKWRQDTPR